MNGTCAADDQEIGSSEARGIYRNYGKRAFDLVLAACLLPVLALPILIISIIVKLDSAGPIFYRGVRAGYHGRLFRIRKFRTMVIDAELIGGGTTALNDARITRAGRWLRKFKLDEWPQIIDVLDGNMSFVGPRPELESYTSQYQGEEKIILSVRPGITDFASIQFASLDEVVGEGDADAVFESEVLHEKNRLRIKYVKSCSFRKDITILWRTVMVIMGKFRRRA